MNINWLVRIKNKNFWLSLIPAVLLLVQVLAKTVGFELDLTELQANILAVVDAVFGVLMILGIVADPTTKGIGDSQRALSYKRPM